VKTLANLVALTALGGCAATPPPEELPAHPAAADCKAEAGQRFIGQRATPEVGEQLMTVTGAHVLRWVPPRTAVTMDFRADRLTVRYDDDFVIQRVSCN
jgi:hypothetical protein